MKLIVDRSTGNLLASVFSQQLIQIPPIIFGSNPTVELSVVDPIPGALSGRLWKPLPLTGYGITLGLGQPNLQPFAGTFTITYGANTTSALAWNASIVTIQAAVTALASIVSAGGATVSAVVDSTGATLAFFYLITFASAGARTVFAGDGSKLTPLCTVSRQQLVIGTDSIAEVQLIKISQNAAGVLNPSPSASLPAVVVTQATAPDATHNGKYTIALTPQAIDGTFSITIAAVETGPIGFDAKAADLQTAIQGLTTVGASNATVTQNDDGTFNLTYVGTKGFAAAPGAPTGDAGLLVGLSTATGVLNVSTGPAEILLGNQPSVQATLEVQITPSGGLPQKISQTPVAILAPIIVPTTVIPPGTSNPTAEAFLPGISKLTGGGADRLDSIATVTAARPQLFRYYDTDVNALVTYMLVTGTTAQSLPGVMHPVDYDGTTNQSIYVQLS